MAGGVFLWGWDYAVLPAVAAWRKVRTDATGHLQVDVVGAPAFVSHCHGWNGGAWQELRVESAANANLRTRLYDGVNPVVSIATAVDIADANRGLFTQAGVRGWDGTFWKSVNVEDGAGDALANARASLSTVSKLYGYNGATWDRLRVMTPADAFVTPTMALQVSSFLMGYDGGDWNMVRVDAAGHLQVDVITAGGTASHCMGWDGANWQTLLVESNVLYNLRVKLYDGATGIDSDTLAVVFANTKRGLYVKAGVYGAVGTDWYTINAVSLSGDDLPVASIALYTIAALHGFDGVGWDRLRTWGVGVLKVGRAEIDSTTVRKTVAGAVVAGAHNLYWISCSPDAPGAEFELTDAIAGGGAVVFDHFDPDKHSEVIHLDPPMKFATGIWIEKFDHIHSLVFCYV